MANITENATSCWIGTRKWQLFNFVSTEKTAQGPPTLAFQPLRPAIIIFNVFPTRVKFFSPETFQLLLQTVDSSCQEARWSYFQPRAWQQLCSVSKSRQATNSKTTAAWNCSSHSDSTYVTGSRSTDPIFSTLYSSINNAFVFYANAVCSWEKTKPLHWRCIIEWLRERL